MPSRNTIEIVINATDNASRVFNSLTDNTQTLGKTLATGIAAGIATAGVAIAGFAAKGIAEFTSFQQGIAEIFTLIPDASQEMKDKLEKQIENLASNFGILPEKAIPAVYQALSAGIPPENMFNFMQTASMAAVGGVVELETAVDGITSVLNAYGLSADKAGNISDVMFTGIRLGKTTFDELSQSLFQVTPIAASLGIKFEHVTAALATITAQGVPTSVASTQIRAALNELGKAGTKVSDKFLEISGKTFKQFIAEGGNVQDALLLLEDYANQAGIGINDLFGSVEGGQAALELTGRNTAKLTDFLGQMDKSAGASAKAFETMSNTIQFDLNKVLANVSVLFDEIGRVLEPVVRPILEAISEIVRVLTNAISGKSFIATVDEVSDAVRPFAQLIMNISKEFKRVGDIIFRFFKGVAGGVPFLLNLKSVMYSLFPKSTADALNVIIDGLNNLWQTIKPIADAIIKWVTDNVELKDVLLAVGIAISSFVIPAILGIVAAIAPVIGTFALLIGGVTLLRKAWEKNFLGIQDKVKGVINFITQLFGRFSGVFDRIGKGENPIRAIIDEFKDTPIAPILEGIANAFGKVVRFIQDNVLPVLGKVFDWFVNDALPAIVNFVIGVAIPGIGKLFEWLGTVWESVRPALEAIFNWFVTEALPAIVDFVQNIVIPAIQYFIHWLGVIWEKIKPGLKALADWFIQDALPSIVNFIQNTVIPGIQRFIDFLGQLWSVVQPKLQQLYDWFVTTALPALVRFVQGTVIPGIQKFVDFLVTMWESIKPTLDNIYNWFVTDALPAINRFINDVILPTITDLTGVISRIWEIVKPALDSFFDWFAVSGLPAIRDFIQNTFITPFTTLRNLITGIWTAVSPALNSLKDGFNRVFTWIKTNVIDPVIGRIQEFIRTVQNLLGIGGDIQKTHQGDLGGFVANQYGIGNNINSSGSFGASNPMGFTHYNGLPFAARDMQVGIHQGERVLTKQENKDYTNGQNNSSKPTVHIENVNIGNVKDQNDANDKARMFVNGLRAQGMEI
jgi:TP901 family phage tail tape measure protein